MKEAMFWRKSGENIQCELCVRRCVIPEGRTGFCRVRKNIRGVLFSLVYGKPNALAIDPIEKKPLFHFAPGSRTLSVSTVGCNFRCDFCQNWESSQAEEIYGKDVEPKEIAQHAESIPGLSWTYTEPTIFFELFYDTAKLTKGKYHVWVTNGYTTTKAIKQAAKYVNAVNVDWKGNEEFYAKVCGGAKLEYVKEALKEWKKQGVWIEITNLMIPTLNDSEKDIRTMCEWIKENLGQVPLHFSRYYPAYKMNIHPTPVETLKKAKDIAEDVGLEYIYIGNVQGMGENTLCPGCRTILIKRLGYYVESVDLRKKGKHYHCPSCDKRIPVEGMQWSPFRL
jgi:pyruvate formate lyase activating enzyme